MFLYHSEEIFSRGDRQKVEGELGASARLGDAKTRVLIPAVNMTKGSVVDIAMATSATPLYFPIAEVGNSNFIDGVVVANAPERLRLVWPMVARAQSFL